MDNIRGEFFEGKGPEIDLSKLKVRIQTAVIWPNGEAHKNETDLPLLVVLKGKEDENVLAEEWLKLMNFAASDSGILEPGEYLQLVRRDNNDDTGKN